MLKFFHTLFERFLFSPAYFILFSAYPIFWMYAYNVHGILLADFFRPWLVSIFAALLIFGILQLVIRHSQTSALIVLSIFLAFFCYGSIRRSLNDLGVAVQNDVFAMVWSSVEILAIILIGCNGRRWNSEHFAVSLNLMTVILLLFPTIKLVVYAAKYAMPFERKTDNTVQVHGAPSSPDIYYIILDSYTRSDVMKNQIEYDNSPFINSLRGMGFYVADCSQSNYSTTALSLSSSLNMDYLQNIGDEFQPDQNDLLYVFKALDSNALRNTLTGAGYKTVAFASGFTWIEWRNADRFIAPEEKGISEFEVTILSATYASVFEDFGIINLNDAYARHYAERTRLVLNSFDELLKLPSPKFVFIHIIAPHGPSYTMDEHGNYISIDNGGVIGYKNLAEYIGRAITPELRKLIYGSAIPPVIIIQGDHGRTGSDPQDTMKILNAYYLPGHIDQLYPSISPVNSFRVVLNSYFGTNFPLLEDVSYFSPPSHKYAFIVEKGTCQKSIRADGANGFEIVR